MASAVQFHLFPPSPPREGRALTSNPFRRSKASAPPQAVSYPLQTLAKSPGTESVVIQITEPRRDVQAPSQVHPSQGKDIQNRTGPEEHGSPTEDSSTEREPSKSPAASISASGRVSPEPGRNPTPSPLATGAATSTSPVSPVIAMRSMFPVFNPARPLSQQSYYPQRETQPPRHLASREDYVRQANQPSPFDRVLGGAKTAPSSVLDFSDDDDVASAKLAISSPQDLEALWQATNGQDPDAVPTNFTLQMSRVESATFVFGSSPSLPFYSLQTYNTNEAAISRIHPRKPLVKLPVLQLSLEAEARRMPPNDGLISYIFPKLAAMLAIDQSSELAAAYGLAPTHRDEMQAEAVARAAAQESCRLTWNERGRRYELAHPAIGRRSNAGPQFAQSPDPSCADGGSRSALHITVSSHSASSSPRSATACPPVILVTNPDQSAGALATPSHPRTSILPVHECNDALASLDLGTMSFRISAQAILQLIPSLYAIDCVVSAVLAVAVADSATNPVMAAMDLSSAAAPPTYAGSTLGGGSVAGRSYAGSTLYATIAEREEAEQEAGLMRQLQEGNGRASRSKKKSRKLASFWRRSERSPPGDDAKTRSPKTKKITMTEFDVEKMCHYQSGARQGQKLPALTTTLIQGLVLALQCIVWTLETLVRILAWLLIRVTRAVTSDKF